MTLKVIINENQPNRGGFVAPEKPAGEFRVYILVIVIKSKIRYKKVIENKNPGPIYFVQGLRG